MSLRDELLRFAVWMNENNAPCMQNEGSIIVQNVDTFMKTELKNYTTPCVEHILPDFGSVESRIWNYFTVYDGIMEITDENSYHRTMDCLKRNFDYIQGRNGNKG